jgi:hypothetical protein
LRWSGSVYVAIAAARTARMRNGVGTHKDKRVMMVRQRQRSGKLQNTHKERLDFVQIKAL